MWAKLSPKGAVSGSFRDSPTIYGFMTALVDRCSAETDSLFDVVDLTDDVTAVVERARVGSGRLVAFIAEPGAALIVNEKETGLWADLQSTLERIADDSDRASMPIGSSSVTLPITDGSLGLGMWQRLLLIELERPGPRSVILQVLTDPEED